MILHRLLLALFDNGVGFVTTSNFKPDDLYPGGMHRDRVLPAIALLNQEMEVVNVDNGVDYRRQTLEQVDLYHMPNGAAADVAMALAFDRLAECQDGDSALTIEARQIYARRRAGGVVWFDFKELCGGPRSQNDYLEIASQFHTVLLSDVLLMPVNRSSEARRFTWLIDVLYDRRVKLVLSAQVPPEALYVEGPLAHEFARTVSRLNEMQSAAFLAMDRRHVDTRLIEYRRRGPDSRLNGRGAGPLIAVALTDILADGLSMVYSFYDPAEVSRSLGTYMILEHIERARRLGLPHVYLGYWVEGSKKMAYKARFLPQERLGMDGWDRID